MNAHLGTAALLALISLGAVACGDDGNAKSAPEPADFTTEIDNPWWPMKPGSRWVYRETDTEGANQKVVVTVTNRTKQIANGVEARVVHDVVTEDGKFVEVTDDWYAQDQDGNIWYLGEDTTEYENGKPVSTSGSFEAGVDGAEPGIIIPANPKPGMTYRQEYYKGEAEDRAKVVSVTAKGQTPYGKFTNAVETEDTTPLEPGTVELKYYAKNVGHVLRTNKDGGGREELVSFTKGAGQ